MFKGLLYIRPITYWCTNFGSTICTRANTKTIQEMYVVYCILCRDVACLIEIPICVSHIECLFRFFVTSYTATVQDKKLTNLDEGAIKNIIGELEEDEAFDEKENSTNDSIAIQKAKNRVQLRLAMEKKAAARKVNNNNSRKGGGDNNNDDDNNDDDDVADLSTFAKNASSGAGTKSKKK